VAPNGEIFVAESVASRIRVLRAADGAEQAQQAEIFAAGLDRPYGIAFWPPGANPRYVYVANTASVVRFPYRPGELQPAGPAETVVAGLPAGGHWTRDLAFSADGMRMFVSVGSRSNVAWDNAEQRRADVLVFTPEGKDERVFATGLRNCSGMAIAPGTSDLWCAVNERDELGDDLPPDYVTRLREGAFYGWPFFYIGGHQDPRHAGEHPELRDRVSIPDVLLQPHSAPLGITFYDRAQFPAEYRGDAFVALHGSWNRAKRTGYKIVRVRLQNGQPTGGYEDFLTGFVVNDNQVWGRPVGVAVAHDGALIVTEDAGGTVWRVSYRR
jgi:glucose/arabinose dehydrogenase